MLKLNLKNSSSRSDQVTKFDWWQFSHWQTMADEQSSVADKKRDLSVVGCQRPLFYNKGKKSNHKDRNQNIRTGNLSHSKSEKRSASLWMQKWWVIEKLYCFELQKSFGRRLPPNAALIRKNLDFESIVLRSDKSMELVPIQKALNRKLPEFLLKTEMLSSQFHWEGQ